MNAQQIGQAAIVVAWLGVAISLAALYLTYCRLPVPWDHPRCQKHGTTSRPQRPAGVMIPAVGQIVKCAVAGVSPV